MVSAYVTYRSAPRGVQLGERARCRGRPVHVVAGQVGGRAGRPADVIAGGRTGRASPRSPPPEPWCPAGSPFTVDDRTDSLPEASDRRHLVVRRNTLRRSGVGERRAGQQRGVQLGERAGRRGRPVHVVPGQIRCRAGRPPQVDAGRRQPARSPRSPRPEQWRPSRHDLDRRDLGVLDPPDEVDRHHAVGDRGIGNCRTIARSIPPAAPRCRSWTAPWCSPAGRRTSGCWRRSCSVRRSAAGPGSAVVHRHREPEGPGTGGAPYRSTPTGRWCCSVPAGMPVMVSASLVGVTAGDPVAAGGERRAGRPGGAADGLCGATGVDPDGVWPAAPGWYRDGRRRRRTRSPRSRSARHPVEQRRAAAAESCRCRPTRPPGWRFSLVNGPVAVAER